MLFRSSEEDGLHYNELKRRVHGVTNTMLTKCLRELEEKGLVFRHSLGSVPPSVTYHLREASGRVQAVIGRLGGRLQHGLNLLRAGAGQAQFLDGTAVSQ